MDTSENYEVKLDIFEGPLDLLLFLIRKKKIDIHDIPVAVITREYLEYLDRKERINLDREGEFLLMAALLIHIKSQMLLPREQPPGEDGDPRQVLVERLMEHQKIKAACDILREREDKQLECWQRGLYSPLNFSSDDLESFEVSLFDLAESFFELVKRRKGDPFKVIKGKDVSVGEKMKEILDTLKNQSAIDFLDYLAGQETLEEALVSFFCLLELVKARIVFAIQEQLFHSIKVWLRQGSLEEVNEWTTG